MNLDRISDGHLQELLASEANAFERTCNEAGRAASKLPTALQQIRTLENNTKWLVPWAVERLRHFSGPDGMSVGAYGITWFSSWQAIFSRPSVASSFRGMQNDGVVIIIGSALGYQCLYALALGAKKCIGYEVLCKTMLSHARDIVSKNDLGNNIEYRCKDARSIKDLGEASLVWINDETFPKDLRHEVQQQVAQGLKPGALAVSYSPADMEGSMPGLQREDAVRVEVSWSYVAGLFVFRKLAPGQMPRPPPIPHPGGKRGGRQQGRQRRSSGAEL